MPNPYKPPFPASEIETPEQRKEWLAWYAASKPERDKQSAQFYSTAGFSLLLSFAALLIVPLGIAIFHEVMKRF